MASTIVRHTFSTRIGGIYEIKGKPHIVKRQVYWKKAIESNREWQDDPKKWKYFYYEVEPIEQGNQEKTKETLPSS